MNSGGMRQIHSTSVSLEQELGQHIDPRIERHWENKTLAGIIPTEALRQGLPEEEIRQRHKQETRHLVEFQVGTIIPVIQALPETANEMHNKRFELIHYFGVGTKEAVEVLEEVVKTANDLGKEIVVYDVCKAGCANATDVVKKLKRKRPASRIVSNRVLKADIEYVCDERFISPGGSVLIIAARVLDVLDNEEEAVHNSVRRNIFANRPWADQNYGMRQWTIKYFEGKKMARTAEKMGKLLKFLKVYLLHPEPVGNERAIWGDTTPSHLEVVAEFMSRGLESEVCFRRLGTMNFWGHIYTAALFERRAA